MNISVSKLLRLSTGGQMYNQGLSCASSEYLHPGSRSPGDDQLIIDDLPYVCQTIEVTTENEEQSVSSSHPYPLQISPVSSYGGQSTPPPPKHSHPNPCLNTTDMGACPWIWYPNWHVELCLQLLHPRWGHWQLQSFLQKTCKSHQYTS